MKRIIIAVLIIIASVGFSLWGNFKINEIFDEVLVRIDDDNTAAYELWQKNRDFLGIFLMHGDVDSIDGEMHAMMKFSQSDRKEDVSECVIRIAGYIENIRQSERLSFGNVF